ncbi:MAG TPA: Holliday junction branch migration DNA helicase RuvB [Patescibacteria group bacterium]|nr:Holliday junction branch migration DNA helicase RuvB [Patescibacteria group bacterium]
MENDTYIFSEEEKQEILSPSPQDNETVLELTLRPKKLTDFVGQEHIKEPLVISLEAARRRQEPLEHVLLYGNPGLGKTTLANIIAQEMNSKILVTSGPALEKIGDLAAILSNLENGEVLFIDEIHRLNKTVAEVLYSAMEDFAIDIIIGKGPTARTMRIDLPRFTLIGATTQVSLLTGPLRDRFGHVYHLEFYQPEHIELIINRNAKILEVTMRPEAARLIAQRARRTPRTANRLLKRIRDFAEVRHDGKIIDETIAGQALRLLKIDKLGLDEVDRHILRTIIEKYNGGPVGLSTLAAAVAEEIDTLETIYEPYLLQIGMLERTPRGRKSTAQAHTHLQEHNK